VEGMPILDRVEEFCDGCALKKQIWHFASRHIQQQTLNKKGKESPAFLDPQMTMRTNITLL
jgi:hypothetical protein